MKHSCCLMLKQLLWYGEITAEEDLESKAGVVQETSNSEDNEEEPAPQADEET